MTADVLVVGFCADVLGGFVIVGGFALEEAVATGAVAVGVPVGIVGAIVGGGTHVPLALQIFGDTQSSSELHATKHAPVAISQR
jgi:hypothetical protein